MKSSPLSKNQKLILGLCSVCIFYVGWSFFVWLLNSLNQGLRILPYPNDVLYTFWHLLFTPYNGATLLDHVGASFFRVVIGFLYAFLLAVPLGLLLGSVPWFYRIFNPIIEIIRPIPPLAWIPFALIAFGLGLSSYSFVIFMGAFFPLLQNIYDGVKQTPRVYIDVARSLGASNGQILWEVILPSILPNIFTGMRISIGVGWMCVIAAEMIGVTNAGIGYFINYMTFIGQYSNMTAGMLMIGLFSLIINYSFKMIEKMLFKWI